VCFIASPAQTRKLRRRKRRIIGYKVVRNNRTSALGGASYLLGSVVVAQGCRVRQPSIGKKRRMRAGIYVYATEAAAHDNLIGHNKALRVSYSPRDVLGVDVEGRLVCVTQVKVLT